MTSIAAKRNLPGRIFVGGPLRMATLAVAAVVVVASVAAGWFGVSWYRAAHDRSLALAVDRDVVLRDAQAAMVNLNTLDYQRVQDGLTRWEQSAAGSLLTQLQANRNTYARAITDSHTTTTTARVLDAAVASLDQRSGIAQVLVGADVTSQSAQADPSCAHRRVRLEMIRAGDSWKVGTFTPVGDGYSESGPCASPSSTK